MATTRRRVLQQGLVGAAALALPVGAVFAQSNRDPLGLGLPRDLLDLLPDGPLDLLETVETVIALEREAEVRRLPHSALELVDPGNLPTDLDALYSAALPRLVALIDRATGARADGGLGDRAGALLSRLHQSERQVPEALQAHPQAQAPVSANSALARAGLLQLDAAALPPQSSELPQPVMVSNPVVQQMPQSEGPLAQLPEAEEAAPAEEVSEQLAPPSRATDFATLSDEYVAYFNGLTIRPERHRDAEWHLTMLRQSRRRYDAVSARTGVPWFFVGATHALEASFNFRGHLHNGDFPLSRRTRQVPANRPAVWLPPSDWESSAVDALRMMGFAGRDDWSLARTLHRLEAYNGFGYRRRQVPTPYLWSFSEHYDRGKFVADGRWSATARSQQCGAAVMLRLLVDAGEVVLA